MENLGALTLASWLHQIATIAWIGGMIVNILIIMPSLGKTLDPPSIGKFMSVMMKRYKVMVYISLLLLFFTGFAIAGLSTDYVNYYDFGEAASNYFLIKHLLVIIVIILVVLAFEVLAPKVAELAPEGPSPKLARMQLIQKAMIFTGLVLGLIILLLSVMMSMNHIA